MPGPFMAPGATPTAATPAPRRQLMTPTAPSDSGPGIGTALLGGAAIAGTAALLHNPQLAKTGLSKLASLLNAGRMTSMLSGFAAPKSLLGNIGAVGTEAIERGSMAPLREFFSPATAKEFGHNLWTGGTVGPVAGGAESTAGSVASRLNPFGRFMGAGDVATRGALQRAGLTAQEAERAVLQTPLEPKIAKALDNPVARTLIPFRRTPLNQFQEGMKTYGTGSDSLAKLLNGQPLAGEEIRQLALLSGTTAAGMTHGVATSKDRFPVSTGLATALANRYGVPYAVGVMLGRHFSGGNDQTSNAASSILPFSEYGLQSTVIKPWAPLNPANFGALKVLKQLRGR